MIYRRLFKKKARKNILKCPRYLKNKRCPIFSIFLKLNVIKSVKFLSFFNLTHFLCFFYAKISINSYQHHKTGT